MGEEGHLNKRDICYMHDKRRELAKDKSPEGVARYESFLKELKAAEDAYEASKHRWTTTTSKD